MRRAPSKLVARRAHMARRELELARAERERQTFANAKRESHEQGRAAGHKAAMDERTLYVAAPRPDAYGVAQPLLLGEEPKRDHVVVPFMDRRDYEFSRIDRIPLSFAEQRIVFRAIRKAFALPNGGAVIWWDWEVRR